MIRVLYDLTRLGSATVRSDRLWAVITEVSGSCCGLLALLTDLGFGTARMG